MVQLSSTTPTQGTVAESPHQVGREEHGENDADDLVSRRELAKRSDDAVEREVDRVTQRQVRARVAVAGDDEIPRRPRDSR